MPAIDPDRLKRQVATVAAAIGDPIELRRRTIDLLEFYADRTRRPGPSTQVDDVPPSFGAPRPVMRAVSTSLVNAASGRAERALAAADALWRADYREARLLAAALVGSSETDVASSWVESHASLADDNVVLAEVAGRGLKGWRKADPLGFIEHLAAWLDSSKRPVQHLALLAIVSAADDPDFHQLHRVFSLLSGRSGSFRGEIRKAFVSAIRALTRRSPPETTHFLLAEVASGDLAAIRVARSVLDALPTDNALRLRQALPAGRKR
jgi:hypothetical protein